MSSDPTAGAQLAASSAGPSLLARLERALRSTAGRLQLAGVLLLLVGLVVLVMLLLRRRRRLAVGIGATAGERHRSSLLAAFERLETALAASGRPRAPAESIAELAARLEDSAGPDVTDALRSVERVCYDRVQVGPGEALSAAAALDRLSTRLLSLALRG